MNKTIECKEGSIVCENLGSRTGVGNLKLSGTLGCVALLNWHGYFEVSQAITFVLKVKQSKSRTDVVRILDPEDNCTTPLRSPGSCFCQSTLCIDPEGVMWIISMATFHEKCLSLSSVSLCWY